MTNTSQLKGIDMLNSLPLVKEIDISGEDWKVYYPDHFESVLVEENVLRADAKAKITTFLNGKFSNFRTQMNIESVELLVAFFYDTKQVRICSSRLNSEMFIIQELEEAKSNADVASILESEKFKVYKNHAESIASMDVRKFPSVYDLTTHSYSLKDILNDKDYVDVEKSSHELIQTLLSKINEYSPSWFEKVSDFGLSLTAQYALLRIHLLKFIAILPSLDHDKEGSEVKRMLLESLRRLIVDSKKAKKMKLKGQNKALPDGLILTIYFKLLFFKFFPAGPLANLVRTSVRYMAKRFIAGETIETAEESIKELAITGRSVTLDQLGELVVSEKEADHYMEEVLKLVRGFSLHVKKGDKNIAGINKAHVSIKVSALCSDFKPKAFDYTYDLVSPRLKKILLVAKEEDVFINIDAEHYDYRDIVFKIYKKVLLETEELKDYQQTGIVLQAYLRDAAKHLDEIIELAKKRNLMMPIRLVKGAYWDAETVEADAHNYDAPEFLNKEETDLHFRQLIYKIFENSTSIQLCIASHNFSDHCFCETLRSKNFPDIPEIEHQCLHMTYEALSVALGKMGWATRNYVPIGSLLVGMAYLVRRIMENSSQVGVLTIMRSHKKGISLLSPSDIHRERKEKGSLEFDKTKTALTAEFFNVGPLRTYLDEQRQWIEKSLENFKDKLGRKYTNSFQLSAGEEVIVSSSDTEIVVGKIDFATKEDALKAIEVVDQAYYSEKSWAKLSWTQRAMTLIKAQELMLARRNELSALIMYEAGKSVDEALADVDEAIDFLNFYAREEGRYDKHAKDNESIGPVAVIAPWNFPLAIPCGMTIAALVAGNTVVLKSAEQTPLIAQVLVDLLHEAGIPKDTLVHLPGQGEIVGQQLVDSKDIAGIVFTGSKAVGVHIEKCARKRVYTNKTTSKTYPVTVVTEMGGKNAVIVTANAELDETVSGILYSSFAHAGQKCSAASRVIVDNSIKERLIERLKEASLDIKVSKAMDFSCAINPLITGEDKSRVQKQVEEATLEVQKYGGKVVVDRTKEELPGYCLGPAVFEVPYTRGLNKESYAQRELFAPVVHIIGVDGLDQALQVFNATEYALTGGIFSQSQDDIDYATKRMLCGNIYVNRTITGARVGIEPFGGFKLSGTGPKAGGKQYLETFHLKSLDNNISVGVEDDKGSEYKYDLCRQSLLENQNRIDRVSKGMETCLSRFELLFQGIHGEDKKVLKKALKWMKLNGISFIEKQHNNTVIPGQISRSDYSLSKKKAIVCSYNDRPEFLTFIDVCFALFKGTGVTILSRNDKSYAWWKNVVDIFQESGISKSNFDVFFASKENMELSIIGQDSEIIIVDGNMDRVSEVNELLANSRESYTFMKKIHCIQNHNENLDFKSLTLNYTNVRSFAVNIMRHGAQMEVEL